MGNFQHTQINAYLGPFFVLFVSIIGRILPNFTKVQTAQFLVKMGTGYYFDWLEAVKTIEFWML